MEGHFIISRNDLPSEIFDKLNESMRSWDSQNLERLSYLIGRIVDLGVAYEYMKSMPSVDTIMMNSGIGVSFNNDSDLGKSLTSLKISFEQRNYEEFEKSCNFLLSYFNYNQSSDQYKNDVLLLKNDVKWGDLSIEHDSWKECSEEDKTSLYEWGSDSLEEDNDEKEVESDEDCK